MRINSKQKGFTIIEVVLVLAIAGLIFMMVFVALPALQRNQRDSQRRQDLSRAIVAVANYSTNNRGSIPRDADDWSNLVEQYLAVDSDTFIDPSGASDSNPDADYYVFASSNGDLTGTFDDNTQNVIYYSVGSVCGESGNSIVDAGSRKVALRMYLEGGGVTCQNN